jgi:hypothetical protein
VIFEKRDIRVTLGFGENFVVRRQWREPVFGSGWDNMALTLKRMEAGSE